MTNSVIGQTRRWKSMGRLALAAASAAVSVAVQAVIIDGYDFDAPETLEKLSKLSRAEVDALSPAGRREYFKRAPGFKYVGASESVASGGMSARNAEVANITIRMSADNFAKLTNRVEILWAEHAVREERKSRFRQRREEAKRRPPVKPFRVKENVAPHFPGEGRPR